MCEEMIVAWATTLLSGESYKHTNGFSPWEPRKGRHTVLSSCAFHLSLYHLLLDGSPSITPAYQSLPFYCLLFQAVSSLSHYYFSPLGLVSDRKEVTFVLRLREWVRVAGRWRRGRMQVKATTACSMKSYEAWRGKHSGSVTSMECHRERGEGAVWEQASMSHWYSSQKFGVALSTIKRGRKWLLLAKEEGGVALRPLE